MYYSKVATQIRVTVGGIHAHYLNDANVQVRDVIRIISHPGFDRLTYFMGNDVAMVVLKDPVTFNDFVQPMCLAQAPPPLSAMCYSAGLGYTSYTYDASKCLPNHLEAIMH